MVEFETSDFPLEKTPFKQEDREFFPTRKEWVSISNIQQINRSVSNVTGTRVILFSVPENHILFITNLSIDVSGTALVAGFGNITILDKVSDGGFTMLQASTGAVSREANAQMSYPMPIRIDGSNNVVTVGTGNIAGFILNGWLEEKAPTGIQQER